MNEQTKSLLEWGGAILAQILVAFIAARAGFLRAQSQNRGDDASAAQIYQRLAQEQATANEAMTKDYEKKLVAQSQTYEKKLADLKQRSDERDAALRSEIERLKAIIGGPYEVTFTFITSPSPEIVASRITLLPKPPVGGRPLENGDAPKKE